MMDEDFTQSDTELFVTTADLLNRLYPNWSFSMRIAFSLCCVLAEKSENPRQTRIRIRNDPKKSVYWVKYWQDERGLYASSEGGRAKEFRRLFRMSKAALVQFIEIATENNWFPKYSGDRTDAYGIPASPLPLLVMGALAHLASTPFQNLADLTNISETTHRRFFDEFCLVGATQMKNKWVLPPRNIDELKAASAPYEAAGLPGAFACTDSVRIRLYRNQHIGKEGFPTRTFNVTVGHTGLIFSVTRGWPGRDPDMKIVEHDEFIRRVRTEPFYKQFEWKYFNKDGQDYTQTGAWILVDDGYPDWLELLSPPKSRMNHQILRWAGIMESLRKDVERVFGILKQRFYILEKGVGYERFSLVDNMFHTCCALHNYLLLQDENHSDLSKPLAEHTEIASRLYRPTDDPDHVPNDPNPGNKRMKSVSAQYQTRRDILVTHFDYVYGRNMVIWPGRLPGGFIRRRLEPFSYYQSEFVDYDLS